MRKEQWELGVYRIMAFILRRLPESAAFCLAECLVGFAHSVCGWRLESTRERLIQVFPERPAEEKKRIRKESVRNLARNIVELIRMPDEAAERIEGREETFAAFKKARKKGKGILLVIAHSGNWDLGGRVISDAGFPVCFIARKQKNEAIYEELNRSRSAGGGQLLDRDDPRLVKKVLAFLDQNYLVAILVDIRAKKPADSWEFLGQKAWLSNGLGLLAAKSGAEVLPVHVSRQGRWKHRWRPLTPKRLTPSQSRKDRHELLQHCLDELGREILMSPESYFWYNKRWVLEPFLEADAP